MQKAGQMVNAGTWLYGLWVQGRERQQGGKKAGHLLQETFLVTF